MELEKENYQPEVDDAYAVINKKLRQYFDGKIVRKDLMEIDLEKAIRRFLRIRNDQNAQLKIKEDGISEN